MKGLTAPAGFAFVLLCPSLLAAVAPPVAAETTTDAGPTASAAGATARPDAPIEEVVVTGYRRSLEEEANAKKQSVGFTDSIFAEDIGKFPDTNIAESFNRIPGITIVRDINGEGVNVAVRGLGPNFTRVLLNGAPIAIASSGPTDAQNVNREVDLNMFPTELFTQLSVYKTATPDLLEGGAAGTVNMRSIRAFDSPGRHLTAGIQGTKNQKPHDWGERGFLIGSKTWESGFGVLLGAVGIHNPVRITGFETIGWTNPRLTPVTPPSGTNPGTDAAHAQCLASSCNSTGGGNWTIPASVPANAGNGLNTGDVINQAYLLAHNPGLTIQQINNAIIPRLGRSADESGDRDRDNAVFGLEFKPNDAVHGYIDSMFGREHNDEQRIDLAWVGRNGAAIPLNMQVDRSDCSNGCVVTQATYANSQFFLEYRPYLENTYFWNTNPGLEWKITDALALEIQGNDGKSRFHREVPSVLPITAASSGVTVDYANGGGIPAIATNIDLDNPANFVWRGGRVNMQDERRGTETRGLRGDLNFVASSRLNIKVGGAYDKISRAINAYDNSQAWQNAVCGDNPNVFLPSPNTQPPCQGLSVAGPAAALPGGYPSYPGLGTHYSAGIAP